MLLRIAATLAALLCLTACAVNSLMPKDWARIGDAGWVMHEGVTSSTNTTGTGFLVSTELFADFELNVEFKPDTEVNSGVLVRCHEPADITPTNCYEINIWDNHPNQDYRTGAIVIHSTPPFEQLDSADQWNTYQIVAVGA